MTHIVSAARKVAMFFVCLILIGVLVLFAKTAFHVVVRDLGGGYQELERTVQRMEITERRLKQRLGENEERLRALEKLLCEHLNYEENCVKIPRKP